MEDPNLSGDLLLQSQNRKQITNASMMIADPTVVVDVTDEEQGEIADPYVSDIPNEEHDEPFERDTFDVKCSLLGLKSEKLDDIYDFYCKHARAIGFSVRKSTTRNGLNGVIVEKYYLCSCEGSKKDNTSSSKKTYITRTGCKAYLRLKMNDDGLYEVVEHNMIHNHDFTRREWSHMHRSERSINKEKGSMIESMITSGMRATDSFRYMAQDAGGEDCIGHTMKDHLNYVNRLKMKAIEGGDAQTLIDNLHQEHAENEDFFFRVKLDEEGRLSNVFWRDSMMKEDFMLYGDVVVFDTTYRTNKYNLICAPIVGINNHWKNVMFGCAFISDETTESFEWIFSVFMKSMLGKCPTSIFTDQDQAIGNAIEKVFPKARHRLCLWHLYQNAVSRFGSLKGNKTFNDHFQKCLSGCTSGDEFEACWSSFITTYNLNNNSWFSRLYMIKEKWCTGFNKDFFSAGILSSQRSESTNSAIGFNAKKTTNLTQFYAIFNRTVQSWRRREANDEFQCSRAQPTSCMPMTGLLKHASEVYTLTLFKDFETEFLKCISTTCQEIHCDEQIRCYSVQTLTEGSNHTVTYSEGDRFICCSCKRFEECGLLCCHCLRIFHMHSVVELPDRYIKKRWTKLAKTDLWDKSGGVSEEPMATRDCSTWRTQMMREYYSTVLKVQENEEGRKIVEDGHDRIRADVEALMTTVPSTDETDASSSAVSVFDPAHSITKGRRKRIKGHLQKNKKKNKSDASNVNEFGSKTPNPRLF